MRKILTMTFCILTFFTYSQDTTYYDSNFNKISNLNKAKFYDIIQHDNKDYNKVSVKTYYISGQIKEEETFSNYKDKVLSGKYKKFNENAQLLTEIDYKEGDFNGKLLTYWKDGKPKRIATYEKGKLIDGKCFNSEGKEILYFDYEQDPMFEGGVNGLMQYLSNEIVYPRKCRKDNIEGIVIISFIVNKDGSISDIKIRQKINEKLDAEALRVVKKIPNWKPGLLDGEPIRVEFNLPIQFKLTN